MKKRGRNDHLRITSQEEGYRTIWKRDRISSAGLQCEAKRDRLPINQKRGLRGLGRGGETKGMAEKTDKENRDLREKNGLQKEAVGEKR